MSLHWRLTLILLLTMMPAAVFSLQKAWSARESEIERIEENAHRLALVAAAYQRELLDGTRRVLTALAQVPDIRAGTSETCPDMLGRLLASFPEYRDLAMFDQEGDIVCNARPVSEPLNVADREWFQEARETLKFTIGNYIAEKMAGSAVLPTAFPIVDDGRFDGVLVATISLDWLQRFMELINLPESGAVHLLARDGTILAAYPSMDDATLLLPEAPSLDQALAAESAPPVIAVEDRSGTRRLYGLTQIEGGDAFVLFSVPSETALQGVAEQFRSLLLGPMAMWALAIIAAWLGSEFLIARWIRHLSKVAITFSRGNLSVRPKVPRGPTELRQLAETFNGMADRIQAREDQLRASLKEKEVLLKEIHHRVNNNLQTVTSLLNLQSRRVADPAARRALDTTQVRVRALSLVHKHLYEGENLAAVDMNAFIAELCTQLWRIYSVDDTKIRPVVDLPPLHLTPDTAIPLGLVITEAVANALKHAFPGDRSGQVQIVLKQDDTGATLCIGDDGIGRPLSGDNAPSDDEKLGMTLIRALALQLRARLTVQSPPGTTIVLHFRSALGADTPVRHPGTLDRSE